jgi:hypothetical protein
VGADHGFSVPAHQAAQLRWFRQRLIG